ISFRKSGDRTDIANHAIVQATTRIKNILVREFPENGMFSWRGGVPLVVADVNFLFNGGYGFTTLGYNAARTISLNNIDGDGNAGGAVIYLAVNTTNATFNIYNARGEYRENAIYGATGAFAGAQPYLLEIGDC